MKMSLIMQDLEHNNHLLITALLVRMHRKDGRIIKEISTTKSSIEMLMNDIITYILNFELIHINSCCAENPGPFIGG